MASQAAFGRSCEGAGGIPDVTDPAISNRLKASKFAQAPTHVARQQTLGAMTNKKKDLSMVNSSHQ